MSATITIDIKKTLQFISILTAVGIFVALVIGLACGSFWYWPQEVVSLQTVAWPDGASAIELTCEEVPGFYVWLMGATENRQLKYYSFDGGDEWKWADFSGVSPKPVADQIRNLHAQWRQSHTPQILTSDIRSH